MDRHPDRDDRNDARRRARRRVRIEDAELDLAVALEALSRFNALVRRDGVTREDLDVNPVLIHDQLLEEAGRILLADVYGELDDAAAGRLLGEN